MGVLGYEPLQTSLADGCGDGPPASRSRGDVADIAEVAPGSLAERVGLRPGDRLLSVNGEPVRDAIDLMFHAAEDRLALRWQTAEGRRRQASLDREPGRELGIVLRDFRVRMCNNNCVFCFIHQNPRGLRRPLYFKDGDFRMSFLHGNYITTTNMSDADFDRIIEQRLSPMYVSVHATNHELRLRMLGVRRSADVMTTLRRLARGGIELHTQIVLCSGWNDGAELERTLRDLVGLRPALLSIAVVPLGLTEHRNGLPEMQPAAPSFYKRTIGQVEPWQRRMMDEHGEPVVYLADEFYVAAGRPLPDYSGIDVLHQLENGVGMVWDFMRPWRRTARRLPRELPEPRRVAVLTGLLGARVLRPVVERLSRVGNLEVALIPCLNGLFGRSITVSGLLSGGDFLRAIVENSDYDAYLLPGNALRAEGEVFLDDMTLEDLRRRTGRSVVALDGDAEDLARAALGAAPALTEARL